MSKPYKFSILYTDKEGHRRYSVGQCDTREAALNKTRNIKAELLTENHEAFTTPSSTLAKSPAEIESAINGAPGIAKAAFNLLWQTHIRATELLAITPQDICDKTIAVNKYLDISSSQIVNYRPAMQYTVPLNDTACSVIDHLPEPPAGKPIFYSLSYEVLNHTAHSLGIQLRDLRRS